MTDAPAKIENNFFIVLFSLFLVPAAISKVINFQPSSPDVYPRRRPPLLPRDGAERCCRCCVGLACRFGVCVGRFPPPTFRPEEFGRLRLPPLIFGDPPRFPPPRLSRLPPPRLLRLPPRFGLPLSRFRSMLALILFWP